MLRTAYRSFYAQSHGISIREASEILLGEWITPGQKNELAAAGTALCDIIMAPRGSPVDTRERKPA
jgi:hypothetical protein